MADLPRLGVVSAMRDLMEEIELADQVGLDVFGVGEHHRPDYIVSAPAVVLAAAAADGADPPHQRRHRAQLRRPGARLPGFATLDLLSGGRAEIMAGRGSFIESFPLFGYDLQDYDELFAEKLELLLKLRASDEHVTWSGSTAPARRRPGGLPAAGPGPAAGVDRRGRHAAVGRARGRSACRWRWRSSAGMPERFKPFVDLYREAAPGGHDPPRFRSASTPTATSPTTRRRRATRRSPLGKATMNKIGRERGWPPLTRAQFEDVRPAHGANFVGSPTRSSTRSSTSTSSSGTSASCSRSASATMPHDDADACALHRAVRDGVVGGAPYDPGDRPATPIEAFGMPIGVQICSDMNRPAASHALAAAGAVAVLHPRATEIATYERWKLVLRSTAVTCCAYVVSVNRPGPEQGVPIGGPSIAIDPNGEVMVETTDPVAVVTLDESVLADARRRYPGYLRTNAGMYAEAWVRSPAGSCDTSS
jgi:alkanesulfonate monooxygenase SsuD/methylene tetrahydromethanopterin reductase-like flavin-dependent oxidoreductase (luciferase family)